MKLGRPAIGNIVSQHAEQAAFLWRLRDRAVGAPHYSLKDLAALDSRIDAHLDGLHIADLDGWVACLDQIGTDTPGEVFAAAAVALAGGIRARLDQVVDVVALAGDHQCARGIVSALAWHGADRALPHVERLMQSQIEIEKLIGLGAGGCLRAVPRGLLELLLYDPSVVVRARALRAVGELGRVDLWPAVERALADGDRDCRYWAGWSACLIGQRSGTGVMLDAAKAMGPAPFDRAIDVAARCLEQDAALRWHAELIAGGQVRPAVICARALGSPRLVPWLLDTMGTAKYARLAGEAFSMMAGIDIVREDLDGDGPEGFQSGPTDDPEDQDVDTDPDEDLPWPALDAIRRWWSDHSATLQTSHRYLLGQPLGVALPAALLTGTQRQRAAAALELALARPEEALLDVRARAPEQRARIAMLPRESVRRGHEGSSGRPG